METCLTGKMRSEFRSVDVFVADEVDEFEHELADECVSGVGFRRAGFRVFGTYRGGLGVGRFLPEIGDEVWASSFGWS